MLFKGRVCLLSNCLIGGPFVGTFIPLVLVGDWLTLQSDKSCALGGETCRSTGDLELLGERFTILMSRFGMIVDFVASFFCSSAGKWRRLLRVWFVRSG